MQNKGTKTIETHRLILRPFRVEDAPAMFRNWAHDSAVTEYLTWQPHVSEQVTAELLAAWEKRTAEDPSCYQWAIELKRIGEPIGSISAMHVNESVESAEIGWCIGRPWWGQGIMPEAGAAVFAYLFDEVGLNRIAARHDIRNPKSGRVMQKLGMTREGLLRQAGRSNAGLVDEVVWSILKSEYAERGALIPEKSCGAAVFTEKDGQRLYLLERMRKGHVSLCKGHVEGDETERETAAREIREETALEDIEFLDGFRETNRYSPYPGCEKTVVFFLVRAYRTETAPQPDEVREILWLPEEAACAALTHESDRKILRAAARFLDRSGPMKGA